MARTFKETTPQKQDFIKKHETATLWNHQFLLSFSNYITVSGISTFFFPFESSALRKIFLILTSDLLQTSPYRRMCIMTDLLLFYFTFKEWIKLSPDKQEICFPTAFCIWKVVPLVSTHILHTLCLVFCVGCFKTVMALATTRTNKNLPPLTFQRATQMLAAAFLSPPASQNQVC